MFDINPKPENSLPELDRRYIETSFEYIFNVTFIDQDFIDGNTTEEDFLISTVGELSPDYPEININNSSNKCVIKGKFPLSIFNNYELTYVDKGSSDKLMDPVIVNIEGVPDNKDIFNIKPDNRKTLDILITIRSMTNKGLTKTWEYKILLIHTYSYINHWVENYFENRY